jgi:probable H4MPT-linked C1 transfer pathway protein
MAVSVLGLDIGGANIKWARSTGRGCMRPFALWKDPEHLGNILAEIIACESPFDWLAVSMTGELCDCFPTKRAGVNRILDAVKVAWPFPRIRVWHTDGGFVSPEIARERALDVAAGNWLALAAYAGRWAPRGASLLIDVGSTTTDMIPLVDGEPCPMGRTDQARMASKELVYTGIRRTPVCAHLGMDGAAELFATMLDVNLVLGRLAEEPDYRDTADGRPATKQAAATRLARMWGGDLETISVERIAQLAEEISQRQRQALVAAIHAVTSRLPSPPRKFLLAGSGEFCAEAAMDGVPELADVPRLSLAKELGANVSTAACAYALAVLLTEQMES